MVEDNKEAKAQNNSNKIVFIYRIIVSIIMIVSIILVYILNHLGESKEVDAMANVINQNSINETNTVGEENITSEENFMDDDHFFSRFLLKLMKQKLSLFIMIALFFCICIIIVAYIIKSFCR